MRLKSLLKRLVDKIVKDALPAGLASILGGLLLTHFQIDRVPQPTTVKVTQASPEMMQLLRDEHGMIIDFVKEQVASSGGDRGFRFARGAGRAAAHAAADPGCRFGGAEARRAAARTRLSVRCRRPRPRKVSQPIRCLRRRERMIRFSPRRSGSRTRWSPSPSARYRRPSASFRHGSARSATVSAEGSPRARRRTWSARLGSSRARRTDSGPVTGSGRYRIGQTLLFQVRLLRNEACRFRDTAHRSRLNREAVQRLPPRRRI